MTTEERAHRGKEIYNTRLAPLLEPEHDGEVVAIDVETGEWALGRQTMDDAGEALGDEGRQVYFHRVGRKALARIGRFGD